MPTRQVLGDRYSKKIFRFKVISISMKKIKMIAIIPARGGSKGLPRKNIIEIGGKPLIVWTIEAAKASKNIDRIIVTSDDDEILRIAKENGVEVLKRPDKFSTDTARAENVLAHALKFAQKNGGLPELVIYLQPTSPLRKAKHIDAAFDLLKKMKGDALISVTNADNKLLKALLVTDHKGCLITASRKDFRTFNRQELPLVYVPNGAIYIMKSKNCLRLPRFHGKKTIPFIMSSEESIDVDSKEDLEIIEKLLIK